MKDKIEAETDFTEYERRMIERQRNTEEVIFIALEAEKAFEELPEGQETPQTFADGTRTLQLKIRDSVAKKLYEDLDKRYGDGE